MNVHLNIGINEAKAASEALHAAIKCSLEKLPHHHPQTIAEWASLTQFAMHRVKPASGGSAPNTAFSPATPGQPPSGRMC